MLTVISGANSDHAQDIARQRGVQDQCVFLNCPADDLSQISDFSVDVVTTRAVLAYVFDKGKSLHEFFRILKPGGRLSIAEPIFQDEALYASALRERIGDSSQPHAEPFLKLLHRWWAAQLSDTATSRAASPIANYSERDLFTVAVNAGFVDVHLQLHLDQVQARTVRWETFVRISPHPWAPCLERILAQLFSPDERDFFESILRPVVESGKGVLTDHVTYLRAQKPELIMD